MCEVEVLAKTKRKKSQVQQNKIKYVIKSNQIDDHKNARCVEKQFM